MASGFDSVATGLLGSVNQNFAQQRKDVETGNAEQFRLFEDAAKEYDAAKAKASDQQAKIDAMANVLSGGKPNPAAYATARDAVEMGYTSEEHLPYVMDAYKSTLKDLQGNPDKWNVPPRMPNQEVADTHPEQTDILRKYGDKRPMSDIENIRQHNINRPYAGLPGANFGNVEDTMNRVQVNKDQAAETAKEQSASKMFGETSGNSPVTSSNDNPNSDMMNLPPPGGGQTAPAPAQQQGSNIAVPAEQLAPPESNMPALQEYRKNNNMPLMTPADTDRQNKGLVPGQSTSAPGVNPPMASQAPTQPGPQPAPNYSAGTLYSTKRNPEVLRNVPTAIANQVIAAADGRIDPTTIFPRDPKAQEKFMQYVFAYDPGFSKGDVKARFNINEAYTDGKSTPSVQLNAINAAFDHLKEFADKAAHMRNSTFEPGNWLMNQAQSALGDPRLGELRAVQHTLATELARAYKGNPVGEQDIQDFSDSLGTAKSDPDFKGTIATTAALLEKRANSLIDGYKKVNGDEATQKMEFIRPEQQKTLEALKALAPETRGDKANYFANNKTVMSAPENASPQQPSSNGTPNYSHLWTK